MAMFNRSCTNRLAALNHNTKQTNCIYNSTLRKSQTLLTTDTACSGEQLQQYNRDTISKTAPSLPLCYLLERAEQLLNSGVICRQPWGRPSPPPGSGRGVPEGSSNDPGEPDPARCSLEHAARTPAGAGHTALSLCGFLHEKPGLSHIASSALTYSHSYF